MRFLLPGLLALMLLVAVPGRAQDRQATVTTLDGSVYQGTVSSRENSLEWRKDIYESRLLSGAVDTFILLPEYKGNVELAKIREIRRLGRGQAPSRVVTLSNGQQASLIQRYLLILDSGMEFYISDFITLENFYIDVDLGPEVRRIYLSQIRRLVYGTPESAASKQPAVKTSVRMPAVTVPPPRPVRTQSIQAISVRTQSVHRAANAQPSSQILVLSVLSGVLAVLAVIFLILLLARNAGQKRGHRRSVRRRH